MEEKLQDYGTFVANDPHFLYYLHTINRGVTEDLETQVKHYISDYVGKGISDLTFCIFGQSSVTPSQVWTTWMEKSTWTEENGVPVSYATDPVLTTYRDYYAPGKEDPLDLLIRETRNQGIHPWLTFRMNDAHDHRAQTGVSRGREFYQYYNARQMVFGNTNGYFDTCFNFEDEEVRRHYLDYLQEQILRYDCDGVDLDFTRDFFCFEYWKNVPQYYCDIMTGFISDVRQITKKAEEKFGHPIKLLVRVTRDVEQSRVLGFDAKRWIELGIVDIIVPSPRWGSTDSAVPISDWVALTEGTDVEVYAGQERFLALDLYGAVDQTAETGKGFAAAAFSQGAKKIYLSNFGTYHDARHYDIWDAVSSPEKAYTGTRRHVVTYQEDDMVPKGCTGYRPLPCTIDQAFSITVLTGKLEETDQITVFCDLSLPDGQIPVLTVGGVTAQPVPEKEGAFWSIPQGQTVAYTLTGLCADEKQTILLQTKNATLHHLELLVQPKERKG